MFTNDSKGFITHSSSEEELGKKKSKTRFTLSDLINFQNEMFKRVGLNCKDSTRENWNKRSNNEIEITFIKKK
jgi:hypothetical protein